MYMSSLPVCISVLAYWLATVRRGLWIPGTRDGDGCELTWGCWGLNPGPLEKQLILLTTQSSIQPHLKYFIIQSS